MNLKEKIINAALDNIDRLAVDDGKKSYTYSNLLDLSHNMNDILGNGLIGIELNKSADYIMVIFGMIIGDRPFIPLPQSDLPEQRISYIIKDSKIDTIITSKENSIKRSGIEYIYIEDFLPKKGSCGAGRYDDSDMAYAIYTSGSTGAPKGVDIEYMGILNIIGQQVKIFNLEKDNIYLYLSTSFDASLSDIFCSFLSGSTLFINDCAKSSIRDFIQYLDKWKITYTDMPPSILKLFIKADRPKNLKTIVIGGDISDCKSVREASKKYNIFNVYGPTEATICTSIKRCSPDWNNSNIGQPINNIKYNLFYNDKEVYGRGELYISGIGLARGYKNLPEMTSSRFVEIDGIRYYKSGDIVSKSLIGDFIFIGRSDRQVKNNGCLVSLEEVEKEILLIDGIDDIAVIFENNNLVALYSGTEISGRAIKEMMRKKLPKYMIPNTILKLDIIPKRLSGKNNYKLLLSIFLEKTTKNEIILCYGKSLGNIISIFNSILKVSIDKKSNFFDYGGDSLGFMTLQIELESIGIYMSSSELIDNCSPEEIINYDENNSKELSLVNEFNNLIESAKIVDETSMRITTNKVLLTGATGFLGAWTLHNLLIKGCKVSCLVRASCVNDAKNRVLDNLKRYKISIDENTLFEFVDFVCGDLSKDKFGLSSVEWSELSYKIDEVYHCAAEVNNLKSFSMLYNSNIRSSIEITKFIFNGNRKSLKYASTLSVFVSKENTEKIICHENTLDIKENNFHTGYAETKWLSEVFLTHMFKDTELLSVYRFGLLTADTINFIEPSVGFLPDFISSIQKENNMPFDDVNLSVDITPVNMAAREFSSCQTGGGIFNISFNKKLSYIDICRFFKIDMVNKDTWSGSLDLRKYLSRLYSDKIYFSRNIFETTDVEYFSTSIINNKLNDSIVEEYLESLRR
jgi:acyl-coenzyme A synthetase/AMP-(fatty) acid ligase/nucleoside-diphosphate-sugar epimerase/acyl carrier protein